MNPSTIMLMHAIAAINNAGYPCYISVVPKKTTKCIQCGVDKTHNNSYCSTKCCKEHKEKVNHGK